MKFTGRTVNTLHCGIPGTHFSGYDPLQLVTVVNFSIYGPCEYYNVVFFWRLSECAERWWGFIRQSMEYSFSSL